MAVAAPPRPPQASTSAGHDPGEALIKEAKQRARRRRWIYGGVATVVAIAAVAGFTIPTSSTPPPNDATPHVPAPPAVPLGAPLVQGPDAASTLLTSWSKFHFGYGFVYADGRVLFVSDSPLGIVPNDATGEGYERHLSPRGLDLVRAGRLDPEKLLLDFNVLSRKKLWVEPTVGLWKPTTYALCPFRPIGGGGVLVNATDVVDELPAPVQAVLDGKQRIYDPRIGTAHWEVPGPGQLGMTDCFELTAAETSNLYQIIDANGFIAKDPIQGAQGWVRVFAYGNLAFFPKPIFPHGQPVTWGG